MAAQGIYVEEDSILESIEELRLKLDTAKSSYDSEISDLKEHIQHLHQHLIELQAMLKKDKKNKLTFGFPHLKFNWYKFFKSSHLFLGLSTSLLWISISIVGIIVRHPVFFGVNATVSSLNSGVFMFGDTIINLSFLLDLAAISLLILTFTGIGLWYYPKKIKKRKDKMKIEPAKRVA